MNTLMVFVGLAVYALVFSLYFLYRVFCMMEDIRFLAEAEKRSKGGVRRGPVAFYIFLAVGAALLVLLFFALRADSGVGSLVAYSLLNPVQSAASSSAW